MTEAAQKRARPGAGPPVFAKNPNHPSSDLIASAIPVVGDQIATHAADLAPDKELQSAAMDWHWRHIDRLGGEARRAAVVEFDHSEPCIGGHGVPCAVLGDCAPGPVQRVRTTCEYQIIGPLSRSRSTSAAILWVKARPGRK